MDKITNISETLNKQRFRRKIWRGAAGVAIIIVIAIVVVATHNNRDGDEDNTVKDKKETSNIPSESAKLKCPEKLTHESNGKEVTAEISGSKKKLSLDEAGEFMKYCLSMEVIGESAERQEVKKSSKETAITDEQEQAEQNHGSQDQQNSQKNEGRNSTQNQGQSTNESRSGRSEQAIADTSNQQSSDTGNQQTQSQTTLSKLAYGSIITPYVNEGDIISVNEAFSMDANNPYWGFYHPGIDFMVERDISVQASAAGTIENLAVEKSSGIMGWHAGFCVNTGTENSICYNLETFSSDQSIGDRLTAGLQVKNGDYVSQGDIIGQLIYGGNGAHIDFGVTAPGTRVCPEPYFTEEAKASVLRLIHILQPTWPMCYP